MTGQQLGLHEQLRTVEHLYELTGRLGRSGGLAEVCEAAVAAIIELAGAKRASVLIFDEDGVMRFKAWRGLSDRYRAAVDGHSPWRPDARDPVPIVVEDVQCAPLLESFNDVIATEGIRALAFVPVTYHGRLLGKFMLYHDVPHTFSKEELALAETIAGHVAFGIARAQADAEIEAALDRERIARTEADSARATAVRESEAKDEFLAMLAHELRNPIGVVATGVTVLQTTQPSDQVYQRSLAAIQRQTLHLGRLLDDLLDVARIARGDVELHPTQLDLRTVVELAIETEHHRIAAKQQQLAVSMPEGPVPVLVDSVRLQQVLGNVLHNASKYTPAGGQISVVLATDSGLASIHVRDNGAGIAPDRLEWVFNLFNQINPALARTDGGLGIGLTIAKRLMELHGGRIRAQSAGAGQGSEFILELRISSQTHLPALPAQPSVPGTKKRILVVEDNDDGRETLIMALSLNGHNALGAASGAEGIELAMRWSPEVVLIDIGLPDIPGYEVGRRLRKDLAPDAWLIALTGYGRPVDRQRSQEAGFDAHLLKPIDVGRLIGTLEELAIQRSHTHREDFGPGSTR